MGFIKTISTLIMLLIVAGTEAQFKFDKAIRVTKETGLPVSSGRTLRKDDEGFMWIASNEGLCRFDGQYTKLFTEGKDLKYSLFDNYINTVLPDGNLIWAGTSQGISVLDKSDYTFRHYQFGDSSETADLKRRFDQTVAILFRDKEKNIWVGTKDKGVYCFVRKKSRFIRFKIPRHLFPPLIPSLVSDQSILSFEESQKNDSIIWAGSTAGLWEINKFSGSVKLFTYPQADKDYQIALNVFRRLYHHDDGLLYVGNWAAGVNVFNPVTKSYTPLEGKNEITDKFRKGNIGKIERKSQNEIWISTTIGLAVYDLRQKEVTWHMLNNVNENELYAMDYIDESGRVWFADFQGVQYFDPAVQQFSQYSFAHLSAPGFSFAFYILSDNTGNNLVICPRFTDGLFHFDRRQNSWKKILFPGGKTFLTDREVIRGFFQLEPGKYIISSDKGLFVYDENRHQLNSFQGKPGFSSTNRGEIILDKNGNLWMPDDTLGLIKWNLQTGSYKIYKDGLPPLSANESFGRQVSDHLGRMSNFFEDSRGNIWFQRANGLGVYQKSKDTILNFLFNQNEKNSFAIVHSFTEDKKGNVWISSSDCWLGYALAEKPEAGVVFKMNLREKGKPVTLQFLATDKNGNIWGTSNKELIKLDYNDLSLTSYSFNYGLSVPGFYHFSFLPTGEMIFGGRRDITIANPAEFKRNTELPVPYITGLHVQNKQYENYAAGKSLQLGYRQNFFSIGFSAMAYTMPKEIRFRYRLKDFDDWKEVKGIGEANYTNVPGGSYTFQLQAANNEGVWNDKILELPVYVATPFWQTWVFRIGLLLFIALVVYALYWYRVNQFRKKEKLKSEYEKKIANVEMSSLLAQMNPHFLFNSLNSIDSYIIKNETHKASEYLNNFARLMRLILQHSRSNYISLKDELESLDLYMQMESLRFQNKFLYTISVTGCADTSAVSIPPMLIQPYVENAIWHGLIHKNDGETGKVEVRISMEENKLRCIVEDNGIGRGRSEELKAGKTGNRKRSMGMQITNDRIEMLNKMYGTDTVVEITDLKDNNGEPAGTRVELVIPV